MGEYYSSKVPKDPLSLSQINKIITISLYREPVSQLSQQQRDGEHLDTICRLPEHRAQRGHKGVFYVIHRSEALA